MLALYFLIFFLIVVLFFLLISRLSGGPVYNNEEEVTTTTTTTTVTDAPAGHYIVGSLVRQFEGTQPFVIDPVDKDKVWLNTKDDLYEDGAGRIWSLA